MAAANVTAMGIRRTSGVILTSFKAGRVFTALALSSSSSSSKPPRKLILYSKPECCLCEGLKEKLEAAFLLSGPDSLHDVHLEVPPDVFLRVQSFSLLFSTSKCVVFVLLLQTRDITTCPCWEKEFQYEIPVLAKVLSDGTEVSLYYCLNIWFYVVLGLS